MPSINGIAHIQLSVSDMERARGFYKPLLTALEMTPVMDSEDYFYCVGGRTGIAIAPADPALVDTDFEQGRVGLHHLCLRARSREDVEAIYQLAKKLGANIIREPREDGFAPGYYSTLFEDPDGIRIEANFVPGKGLLE